MSIKMKNGTVLPSSLLGIDHAAGMSGFRQTYQNYTLKFGVVIDSYSINSEKNVSGLSTEYDVIVFEQNENKSSTPITYRNCLSSEGLGSIADFFETTLRKQTKEGKSVDTKNQNGAVVLLLCLNGLADSGIIIGALTHPDRQTTLVDDGPHLEGEFNGVNIKVEKDGSTTLTFMGATDNNGNVIDPSQGNTEIKIEKDGSYQVDHKTITQRLDKSGVVTLTAQDNIINNTQKNFNITAGQDINVNAQSGNVSINALQLAGSITGSCSLTCATGSLSASGSFGLSGASISMQAQGLANIQAPVIVLNGQVSLGGNGGSPVLTMNTIFIGSGNLGMPVVSRAVSGFANKVTAQ